MLSVRRWALGLVSTLPLTAPATNAFAHAHLASSTPAANTAIAAPAAPAAVTLRFTEPLEARFSGFEIKDTKGATVKTAKQPVNDPAVLSAAPAAPLTPGTYRVNWHIVAHDGHRMQGNFTFTVKP